MKAIITTGLLCAVVGASVGWMNASERYEAKARKLVEDTEKAEQVRADKAQGEVDELFETWKDALVVPEPIVRVERVFVKAAASVCPDQSREMDNGPNGVRVELESGTVRSLDAVADKHERLYKRCATQLKAAQALLKAD